MTCNQCGREMAPSSVPAVERARAGRARHHGRGLCHSCYGAAQRDGTLYDHEKPSRTRAELLEEWHALADPTLPLMANCRALAPRLGMKPESMERALARAGVRSRWTSGGHQYRGDAA